RGLFAFWGWAGCARTPGRTWLSLWASRRSVVRSRRAGGGVGSCLVRSAIPFEILGAVPHPAQSPGGLGRRRILSASRLRLPRRGRDSLLLLRGAPGKRGGPRLNTCRG